MVYPLRMPVSCTDDNSSHLTFLIFVYMSVTLFRYRVVYFFFDFILRNNYWWIGSIRRYYNRRCQFRFLKHMVHKNSTRHQTGNYITNPIHLRAHLYSPYYVFSELSDIYLTAYAFVGDLYLYYPICHSINYLLRGDAVILYQSIQFYNILSKSLGFQVVQMFASKPYRLYEQIFLVDSGLWMTISSTGC